MTTTSTDGVSADSRPRISFGRRAAYGLGDLASNLVWGLASTYLVVFYTDQVGITAGVVALILLVARIADAVIDPIIGALAERTRTRWGRFRPWILFGTPPLALFSVLTFVAPFKGDTAAAIAWAIFTYGVFGFLYSAVNVPYGAITSVMAETTADRVSLSSFRIMGANASSILGAFLTVPLILLFSGVGDGKTQTQFGYLMTAIVLTAIAVPLFYAVFFATKETVKPVSAETPSIAAMFKVVGQNGPLMIILFVGLFTLISFFGRLGVVIYYLMYNVQNFALIPVFMALPAVASILGIALFTRFARRVGKRTLLMIGLAAQAALLTAIYFVGWTNITALLILTALYGMSCFALPLVLALVADCIDYGEHTTGIRTDGVAYATFSFSTKIASAIGGAAGVAALGAVGYIANAQQTPAALQGINLVVNIGPAALCVIAMAILALYKITDAQAATIRSELDAKSHA